MITLQWYHIGWRKKWNNSSTSTLGWIFYCRIHLYCTYSKRVINDIFALISHWLKKEMEKFEYIHIGLNILLHPRSKIIMKLWTLHRRNDYRKLTKHRRDPQNGLKCLLHLDIKIQVATCFFNYPFCGYNAKTLGGGAYAPPST